MSAGSGARSGVGSGAGSSATGRPLLTVEGLHVHLGHERHPAVRGVDFSLHKGERAAILGPSGCGKTTTLRALAGFEEASEGRVLFDGKTLTAPGQHVAPHQRGIGMVFQDFALFPHLSVAENVAFGLGRASRAERDSRAEALLSLVGLGGLGHRLPGQLSGGQQQRVALARALAPSPKLLLLDEPFSSLDAGLRAATRAHTERVLAQVGSAALLVTHDQTEALSFAHHLLVMNCGRVEQMGAPETLYRAPRNAFVARFLGAANLLEAEASGESARSPWGSLTLQRPAQGKVLLCVRPEDVWVRAATAGLDGRSGAGGLPEDGDGEGPGARGVPEGAAPGDPGGGGPARVLAEVASREFRGASCVLELRREDQTLMAVAPGSAPWRAGDRVTVSLPASAAVLETADR